MSKPQTAAQRRAAADKRKKDSGLKKCSVSEWIPKEADAKACKKRAKAAIARELKRQGFSVA